MIRTFTKWKRAYKKDRICKTPNEVKIWLHIHGINNVPTHALRYSGWACSTKHKILLTRYKLILNVKGFSKPYYREILSFHSIPFFIKREYFKIFGSICKIEKKDIRTIERKDNKVTMRNITITAHVISQYKEERATHKIKNFYLNMRKTSPRRSSTFFPEVVDYVIRKKSPRKRRLSLSDLTDNYRWSTDEYHNMLVRYFTDGIEKEVEHPRLVLMFGLPGSGKNWVLKKRRKRQHVIINVDDCLAMLPDYWRGMIELQEKDKNTHDWINTFRSECKVIAWRLFDFAIKNKMNIVWNGTGKNMSKYRKIIEIVKKKGYIIELNGIWVPLKIARERVKRRRESYGRAVPDKILELSSTNIPTAFKELRHEADYARIWRNYSCLSPRVIWDKHEGWLDENEDVDWITPRKNY